MGNKKIVLEKKQNTKMTQEKIQLPLFEDTSLLPTGKVHVSYSEISDWLDCSYRHKLKHIDKINLDKPSIHTEYGRAIHDALEGFVMSKVAPVPEEVASNFEGLMAKLASEHNVVHEKKEIESFSKSIPSLLKAVPAFLDSEFPGWSAHAAEMALMESIEGQTNKKFKGFIDSVIRVPRSAKSIAKTSTSHSVSSNTIMRLSELKALSAQVAETQEKQVLSEKDSAESPPVEYDYYIIDWKTTNYGWSPDKKRDYQKQLQLILYKHFFCKIMNLPLERVKCGFVLLKRTPRKSDNSHVEYIPVSVGPKTQEKGLKTLHDMINQIQARRTLKNRNSCRYCAYNGTEHCT